MIEESNKDLLAAKVVKSLKHRFNKQQIYTAIGDDVLIMVNPFHWLDIHNAKYVKKYMNADDLINKHSRRNG